MSYFAPQPKTATIGMLNAYSAQKKAQKGKKELVYTSLRPSAPKASMPDWVPDIWGKMAIDSGEWTICLCCLESGYAQRMYDLGKAGKVALHNHADCWHHIMGRGGHTKDQYLIFNSILNFCPANNFQCHIKDHSKVKNNPRLLCAVFKFIKIAVQIGAYKWRVKDVEFYKFHEEIYKAGGCYFQEEDILAKKLSPIEYLENILLNS